jgi:hypothetical protein
LRSNTPMHLTGREAARQVHRQGVRRIQGPAVCVASLGQRGVLEGDHRMSTSDLTNAIEQSHAALGAILKGDPSVYEALYSSATM